MRRSWYIPRRSLLRGAGAAIGLPFFEAMIRPGVRADAAQIRRFAGIFAFQFGIPSEPNDPIQKCHVAPWTPKTPGDKALGPEDASMTPAFDAGLGTRPPYLKPFFDKGLLPDITILTGVTAWEANGGHDSKCCFLTGSIQQSTEWSGGTSTDQVIAQHFQQQRYTPIPSIQYSAYGEQTSGSDVKPINQYVSWKNAREPIPSYTKPSEMFDRLFESFDPTVSKEAAERRRSSRLLVADSVLGDYRSMRLKLGRGDQLIGDQYLDSLAELETRIKTVSTSAGAVGPRPTDTYPSFYARIKAATDVVLKAFETDQTRVAMLDYMNTVYPRDLQLDNTFTNWHDVSHWRKLPDGNETPSDGETRMKWVGWFDDLSLKFLDCYMHLLSGMKAIRDPDGRTALDNSIAYIGGDMMDGHDHTWYSMPVIIGGRAGGQINAGRHLRFAPWTRPLGGMNNPRNSTGYPVSPLKPGEHSTSEMLLTFIQMMGVPMSTYGNATSTIKLS